MTGPITPAGVHAEVPSRCPLWVLLARSIVSDHSLAPEPLPNIFKQNNESQGVVETTMEQAKPCQAIPRLAGPAVHRLANTCLESQTDERVMMCGALQHVCTDESIWQQHLPFCHQTISHMCMYWFLSTNGILWYKTYNIQYFTCKQPSHDCNIPCHTPLSGEIVYYHNTRAHTKCSKNKSLPAQRLMFGAKNGCVTVARFNRNTESGSAFLPDKLCSAVRNVFLEGGVGRH